MHLGYEMGPSAILIGAFRCENSGVSSLYWNCLWISDEMLLAKINIGIKGILLSGKIMIT